MKREFFGGRYATTGVVMKGGGGEVYVCDDPNLERQVVVKFLLPGVDKSRLQDEVTALQKIRSKNVVQVLDLVEDAKRGIGIVVEFLSGNDLTDLTELPSDRDTLLRMIYQLSNGISDIHAAGIVHRDIKPGNVKYGDERILKIFDFNLARDELNAKTKGFRGTPGFAAPEQYSTGVVALSAKADIYALGVVIAYLVGEGKLPAALTKRPPDPGAWPGFSEISDLDKVLADLLDLTLLTNPADRPAAMEIRNLASSLLRYDAHRATITVRDRAKTYQLDASNRVARLKHSSSAGGTIEITYNGREFLVTATSGLVLINHAACAAGQCLPDSCVIDLGSPSGKPADRLFVTFDLSHPEVVQ